MQTTSSLTRGKTSIGDDLVDIDWITLRLTSTISSNLINEARFQYGRDFERQTYPGPLPGEPTTAPPGGVPPQIGLPGYTIGKPNFLDRRSFPDEKRWQYADTITVLHGNHTFKFGADINHVNDVNDNLFTESGSYVWSTTSDFFVDYANFLSNGALRALSATTPTTNPLAAAPARRDAPVSATRHLHQASARPVPVRDRRYQLLLPGRLARDPAPDRQLRRALRVPATARAADSQRGLRRRPAVPRQDDHVPGRQRTTGGRASASPTTLTGDSKNVIAPATASTTGASRTRSSPTRSPTRGRRRQTSSA